MARLDDLLPPGEFVRWRSPPAIRPWALAGWSAPSALVCGILLVLYARVVDAERVAILALIFGGLGLLLLGSHILFLSASEAAITEAHIVWSQGFLPWLG